MELNLIVPVEAGAMRETRDEEINGRLWRVTGPHDPKQTSNHKFHCIFYTWGPGIEEKRGFFDHKRQISDKTRPALEAAIEASESIHAETKGEKVEAFWIDSLYTPQLEGEARQATLENMSFIYSAVVSVINVF